MALPFVTNGWYAGPFAEKLGGADVSWIPGLLVTGAVYLAVTRFAAGRRTERSGSLDTPVSQSVR